MLNEVDIDFRMLGLPHSVKQADNCRVRELVKKIENHPHRQSLQRDLHPINACNPFSERSKKMIEDMGNVELFELFETEPEKQCKECLLYWKLNIIYCTCGHLLNESEAMSLRRDDLMATDMGKLQNTQRTSGCPFFEKEMHQEEFKGSAIVL